MKTEWNGDAGGTRGCLTRMEKTGSFGRGSAGALIPQVLLRRGHKERTLFPKTVKYPFTAKQGGPIAVFLAALVAIEARRP